MLVFDTHPSPGIAVDLYRETVERRTYSAPVVTYLATSARHLYQLFRQVRRWRRDNLHVLQRRHPLLSQGNQDVSRARSNLATGIWCYNLTIHDVRRSSKPPGSSIDTKTARHSFVRLRTAAGTECCDHGPKACAHGPPANDKTHQEVSL
jgi:hypothetical protein